MKTPDEIKQGLELCAKDECFGDREGCPYNCEPKECVGKMCMDALAYIRQLEAQRDAAVNDISLFPDCGTCKYNPRKKGYIPNDCDDCINHCNWQWRGLPEPPKEEM